MERECLRGDNQKGAGRMNKRQSCAHRTFDARAGAVDAPCDRLKILDVKYPRVEITVPADNVKGMMIQYMTG